MAADTQTAPPKILVVDDEPLIRMSAIDVARDAGFGTMAASGADQAIKLLEQTPDISLLFTDIRMAGDEDGLTLAKTVRERWPDIRVIVTSGHLQGVAGDDGISFLAKPYSPEELTRALKQLA